MGERIRLNQEKPGARVNHKTVGLNKTRSQSNQSPVDRILNLQKTLGNETVTRLIQTGAIQASLKIGQPGDIYEREADRVADQVMRMRMPETGCPECEEQVAGVQRQAEEEEPVQAKYLNDSLLQRQVEEEEEEQVQATLMEKRQLQRQEEEEEEISPKTSGNPAGVSSDIESRIQSMKGGGQPLPETTRAFFEPRFGADFSKVRVHTDSSAAETAQAINAKAFTTGKDIVFGSGQYSPGTSAGKRLLAHELTHVLQQSWSPGRTRTLSHSMLLSKVPSRRVQRTLVATGDGRGFASLANSAIGVQYEVVVSSAGNVTLRTTDVQGPLTSAAQELVSVLQTVISNSHATTIRFVHGAANVIVGSYALSRVDLDDIAAFGGARGRGLSAGTALAHEITEQYRKQVHRESYPVAHAAGLASEARAAGATITPGPMRQISPGVVEINDIYTYPDRTREQVTIRVTRGNVTSVTRRRLP